MTIEKEIWAGTVNCGKVTRKCMGEIMENDGYFSRFVYTTSSWYQRPVSGDKNVFLLLVQGEYIFHRKFVPCL